MTHIGRVRLYVLPLLLAALALSSSALSSSPPPEPPPPTEITVGAEDQGRVVQLHEGEELVVSLEANPSTGYAWEADQGPVAVQIQPILVQTGESFAPQRAQASTANQLSATMPPLLGAPEIQTLRFQAAEAGETTLRLVYRRPWEEDASPAQEFSLSVEAIGPFTQAPTPMSTTPQATSQPPVDLGAREQLGLPAAFNWCDLGGCTPVKDQGYCGSCWAFSTVGPLESNILIHDGLEKDLSEQYLLSCNTDGWDCGGGQFVHAYHQWKIPPGEPEAGAVYEADFPYTAWEAPCNPPHTHHEKIEDWEYVGNWWSIPAVEAIKQAILDHGPVSVALCIQTAFQRYTGGIFLTDECGALNHAVVLVGWDDNQGPDGIWYLRNSWGPYWGEDGYMRIGYGISSVGYEANYVVYQPACLHLETQVYPAGTGTTVADPEPNCGSGYERNTLVELTAEGNPGWDFSAWGGDASGSDNPTSITMDADKSVAAHMLCLGCTRRHVFPVGMNGFEQD